MKPASWPDGAAMLAAGLAALPCAFLANMSHGEAAIGAADIIRALFHPAGAVTADVIGGFRLPRAVMGVLAGAALAVSGALMQATLRNPMVSPGILGISAGSFLAIVLAAVLAPGLLAAMPVPLAVSGGFCAATTVYLLAGNLRATPLRILLSGLIVSMTLSGVTSALLLMFEEEARFLIAWSAGSLRQNGWGNVRIAAPWIAACLALALLMARSFDIASLGEDTAAGLGQRRGRVMALAIGLVLVMTGAAVAATGPIGFVGLVAPHFVKLAGARRNIVLLPASALWGAALLLFADTLTYVLGTLTSAPPVGAVTAAIGAPWLLWLVLRRARGAGMNAAAPFGFGRALKVHPAALFLCLLLLCGLALVCGIVFAGGAGLSVSQALHGLAGQGEGMTNRIVRELRLPRILAALLAGGGFALAGALFQAALRNPLADSSIVGVNGGAAAGILSTVALFPAASATGIAGGALAGAGLAAAAVYLLAWRTRLTPTFLILIGISVSALCGALVQIIVMQTRFTGNPVIWLVGGLYGANWNSVAVLSLALACGLGAALPLAARLELLSLGDLAARSLGAAVTPLRLAAGLSGAALAAVCVSQTGPIGYVGLLAPHLARLLCGHSLRLVLPASVLTGGLLLALSDIAARLIVAPAELPAGSVIALVGAPYLIYLIRRSMRA